MWIGIKSYIYIVHIHNVHLITFPKFFSSYPIAESLERKQQFLRTCPPRGFVVDTLSATFGDKVDVFWTIMLYNPEKRCEYNYKKHLILFNVRGIRREGAGVCEHIVYSCTFFDTFSTLAVTLEI